MLASASGATLSDERLKNGRISHFTCKVRRSICALSSAIMTSRSARRATCSATVASRASIVCCMARAHGTRSEMLCGVKGRGKELE